MEPEEVCLVISNIPKAYHSSDLRNYFAKFIESSGFVCCHFIHRPQSLVFTAENVTCNDVCCCCFAIIHSSRLDEFMKNYHEKYWIREDCGKTTKCIVNKIDVVNLPDGDPSLKSRGSMMEVEKRKGLNWSIPSRLSMYGSNAKNDSISLTKSDLLNLRELNPPKDVLPKGNVGTETKTFLQLIKECRLPPKLIGKLGLIFPRSYKRRIYSNVNLDYETSTVWWENSKEIVKSSSGHIISRWNRKSRPKTRVHRDNNVSLDDNDETEEWDRHCSLHNDVTEQERNKERLYENDLEVTWDKGSSGLVFHTDAKYWDDLRGDFDERTADDWDVDMGKPGDRDKDAEDMAEIRENIRRSKAITDCTDVNVNVKSTLKYTKERRRKVKENPFHSPFGRRILEKQGWSDGRGLGKTIIGPSVPIDAVGQKPRDKSGLGYRGEELIRFYK